MFQHFQKLGSSCNWLTINSQENPWGFHSIPVIINMISLIQKKLSWLSIGSAQTLPTQVPFPDSARDFLLVNFQCRLSHSVCTHPCAIACVYICMHVKDPVVHVRVRWIMETLKHPACTVGWVARLCCGYHFWSLLPVCQIRLWKTKRLVTSYEGWSLGPFILNYVE